MQHMEHRKRFEADTILESWTPPEVLTRCFPGGFFGEDKGGHPVWYECMGNLDFRGTISDCIINYVAFTLMLSL